MTDIHHFARSVALNDTIVWLSTPAADLRRLARDLSIAEARTLVAALSHGRSSPEYATAAAAEASAQAAYDFATAHVDATIDELERDNVVRSGDEYMVVRSVGRDSIEVGRAAYGSERATHVADATVFKVDLRVEATFNVELIVDGEGSPITTGDKGDIVLPYAGRISAARIVADQDGDLVVDVLRAPFPTEPVASIIGGGGVLPFLAGGSTYADETLTGWDAQSDANDTLRVLVVSASAVTRFTLVLTYTTSAG